MNTFARLVILTLIINSLAGCARGIKSEPTVAFPSGVEVGAFAATQSYRAELQGKIPWEQLENQTLVITHEKQSKVASELAAKIVQETTQAQQQRDDLLQKNKQLQRELRKNK
jgi:hypothetical protein